MPWIVLLVSAVFEAVWATALGQSEGLSRPVPAIVFFIALALSMGGLGWSLKHIPLGTAYAVWVGVGAALTVIWAMATGVEPVSVGKVIFLSGIILAVVGLKVVPSRPEAEVPSRSTADAVPEADAVPAPEAAAPHGDQSGPRDRAGSRPSGLP